ncbi:MAG: hypothetical protein GY754_37180 [bacterium]|nr:hypothetical protein [bacterium]
MKEDLIVEEVRKIRQSHAAKFNYELHKICDDLKEKEEGCGHPIVSLSPKPYLKATGS